MILVVLASLHVLYIVLHIFPFFEPLFHSLSGYHDYRASIDNAILLRSLASPFSSMLCEITRLVVVRLESRADQRTRADVTPRA